MGISFLTLRRRSPKILKEIVLLPRSAWRTVELDIPTRKYRTPRVYEQVVRLRDHQFRQLYILDLGHEEPTVLLTNELRTSSKNLISRYAQRMLIENALSDAVRFFHLDALSSSVGMKVDFDMALLVVARNGLITNRNQVIFDDWMKLDIQYIESWSIKKDILLLLRTVKTTLYSTGF